MRTYRYIYVSVIGIDRALMLVSYLQNFDIEPFSKYLNT